MASHWDSSSARESGRTLDKARGLMVFFLAVWPIRWRRKSRKEKKSSQDIPSIPKDIQEVKVEPYSRAPHRQFVFDTFEYSFRRNSSSFRIFTHGDVIEGSSIEYSPPVTEAEMVPSQESECNSGTTASCTPRKDVSSYLGWGNWYSLEELEIATDGFSERNIIGEGGYGIVYKGAVSDGTMVACKYLTNKDQGEREFLVEVETIGRVRHKNLVKLLGFCAEGDNRILVYEYVNNGNLDEWLHGKTSRLKTPSWDARMKIVLGTAKGLAYMHEAIEPKIVHRDIKASNILLDRNWTAKVSDFGLAKFLGCEKTHVMTRVMGTFGYVAPEYANTGLLNERSDVYSFGVLLMEVVTGRDPVDYSRAPGEVNLVDWLKIMLATKRMDEIADPRLEEKPSPRALKKALITAFQCVHPDVRKRPTMGHVVHLLEAENFQLPESWRAVREMGLSKLVESQTQKRLVQSLSKELQGHNGGQSSPRRTLAHQRYAA